MSKQVSPKNHELFSRRIEFLEVSPQLRNLLIMNFVLYIGEAVQLREEEDGLYNMGDTRMFGIGPKRIEELRHRLQEFDLEFGMDVEGWVSPK